MAHSKLPFIPLQDPADFLLKIEFSGKKDKENHEKMILTLNGMDKGIIPNEIVETKLELDNVTIGTHQPRSRIFYAFFNYKEALIRFQNTLPCNVLSFMHFLSLQSVDPAPADILISRIISPCNNAIYAGYYDARTDTFKESWKKNDSEILGSIDYVLVLASIVKPNKVSHVFVVVFDLGKKVAICFDSAPQYYSDPEREEVVKSVSQHLYSFFRKIHHHHPAEKWASVRFKPIANQQEPESCNAMAVYYVHELVKSNFTSVPRAIPKGYLQPFLCRLMLQALIEQPDLPGNQKGRQVAELFLNRRTSQSNLIQ